ncbi:hypothetical protein PFDSM3638_04775 [Pyrococcus furiosus DSM 3638]|uniref:Uncharacterized protein n=2 Tax=Pyrococcus furiosus TaxID=2261 RepID=A0A5C0XP62_PYRFU|nr:MULTISPECIES: hypothetical protein [Pyrococcus]AFN03747.1 hypothetical protein PFC_03990 [Pyrococcus furiosus COM1]MDK2870623.1 hypothetical protein [Pyrococcus sp.]QEK78619.1 hypothetical protein PFDSM3638_04775 [Pyrococcus furiosus DSM 3638]
MKKKEDLLAITLAIILLLSIIYIPILGVYILNVIEDRRYEQIPWTQECSKFVEYPLPQDPSSTGKNATEILLLRLEGKWIFNLTGCAYEDGVLFLKFTSKRVSQYSESSGVIQTPLAYISDLRVVSKVNAEKVIVYIRGDTNKKITVSP